MTTLTPHQRLEAYKWALENEVAANSKYLCTRLKFWYHNNNTDDNEYLNDKRVLITFPELAKRKPNRMAYAGRTAWFKDNDQGNAQREALLKECIKEVEKLIV